MSAGRSLDLVVLTSGAIGVEVAAELALCPAARAITLVTAPYPRRDLLARVRRAYRYDGAGGLATAVGARLRRAGAGAGDSGDRLAALIRSRCPGVRHVRVPDFHHPDGFAAVRSAEADLGVVVGTRVLRRQLFTIPRLGCLNLHLGRAPEFRGSSPGFYELLQGVGEVGITVHRVTDTLDGGDILLQRTVPLELAPAGDPLDYLRRYQLETLVPAGARLMAEAVRGLADGTAVGSPQDHSKARTYRQATHALKRELRRTVEARRRQG